jgi:hypothetical protein
MLKLDFKRFLENFGGGSFIPTSFSNSDSPKSNFSGRIEELPGGDFVANPRIEFPYLDVEGIVVEFLDKENPMIIHIKDKNKDIHKIATSYEQMKNFQGELPIVKDHSYMKVRFLRVPEDRSQQASNIMSCKVNFIGNSGLRNQYNIRTNGSAYMYPPI